MQVTHAPLTRTGRAGCSASERPRGRPLRAEREVRGTGAAGRTAPARGFPSTQTFPLTRCTPGRPGSLPAPSRTHTQRLHEGFASRPRKPPSTPKAGDATRPGSTPGSNPTHSTGAGSRLPRRRPRGAQECEVGVATGWGPRQPSELRAWARERGGPGPHGGGAGGGRESTPVCRGAGPPAA